MDVKWWGDGEMEAKTIKKRAAFIHKGFSWLKGFQIFVGNGFYPIKTSRSRSSFIYKGVLRTNFRRKQFSPQENPEIQVSIPNPICATFFHRHFPQNSLKRWSIYFSSHNKQSQIGIINLSAPKKSL